MINRIWVDSVTAHLDPVNDMTDVFVETDDGLVWSASFVTIPYLQHQMFMSRQAAADVRSMSEVSFISLETPHVIVENLLPDTIEDTVDNLMTMGTFESVFTLLGNDLLM
jgi:hypothetical protein